MTSVKQGVKVLSKKINYLLLFT